VTNPILLCEVYLEIDGKRTSVNIKFHTR